MSSSYRQTIPTLFLLLLLFGCVAADKSVTVQPPPPTMQPTATLEAAEPTTTATARPSATPTVAPTEQPSPTTEPTIVPIETILPANLEDLGGNRFFNPTYGVGVQLPEGWILSRRSTEHHFDIRNGEYRFVMMVSDEEGNFVYPLGAFGAGSFLVDETAELLSVLGNTVVHRYLTFEGERRMLLYTAPDNELLFEANPRLFHISLAKKGHADLTTETDRAAIAGADQIVQSLFLMDP